MRARTRVPEHPTNSQGLTQGNQEMVRAPGTSRPVLEALAPISDLMDKTPAAYQTRLVQRVATRIRDGLHPHLIAVHLSAERPDASSLIDITAWINSRVNTLPRP